MLHVDFMELHVNFASTLLLSGIEYLPTCNMTKIIIANYIQKIAGSSILDQLS